MTSIIRQLASVALPLLVLSACATTKAPPGLDLPAGRTLHIEATTIHNVDLQLQSKATATASGVALSAAGAAGGAALGGAGGAIMGLGCGPMFIVCSPLAAAAGAGYVGFMGGAVGAGYGGKGYTSGDKGERFNEHTASGFEPETLAAGLNARLARAAGPSWTLEAESPNVVTVAITSLRAEHLVRQNIRLTLEAQMTAVIDGETRMFRIRQQSPEMHIDVWLDGDGRRIRQEVNAELDELTRTVVETLGRAEGRVPSQPPEAVSRLVRI